MSAITVHLAFGMGIGVLSGAPRLWRQWHGGACVAPAFARLFGFTVGLGIYAAIPNILHRMGIPRAVSDSRWMNLFLFNEWIGRMKHGGMYLGAAAILAMTAAAYALLILAIVRADRNRKRVPGPHR